MPWVIELGPPIPPVEAASGIGFDRPHLAFPYSRGSYVEEGTDEHQSSRAQSVLACPVGWRSERPEFGWIAPLFRNVPLDPGSVRVALQDFAGVTVLSVTEYADEEDAAIRHMTVDIQSTGYEAADGESA
jgi:hypothetical protein